MKKTLLLFCLLFTLQSYSQKESTIPSPKDTFFYWKNGNDKIVKVKYSHLMENVIDKEIHKNVVINVMVKSKLLVKNKLTYVPISLTLFNDSEKNYATAVFRAKNSFGVETEHTEYYIFDAEGNVTTM
jgi:hypothetical protein